jgi:hypothetical protein
MKKCTKCGEDKDLSEFQKDKSKKDGLRPNCKFCAKKYTTENSDKRKLYDKQYYLKNKEKINERKTNYCRLKRKQDCFYKFKKNLRRLIQSSFKRGGNNFSKKTKTELIIGCSAIEFKEYISSMFLKGMTIENHGEWHLDHIIPLSTAKTEEDVIRLNHYTNFQPLWAKDNLSKGNKIL